MNNEILELLNLLADLKFKTQTLLLGETSRGRALTISTSETLIRYHEQLQTLLQGDWIVLPGTNGLSFVPSYATSEKSVNILKRVSKKLFRGYDSYLELLGITQEKFGDRVGVSVSELLEMASEIDSENFLVTPSDLQKISKKDPKFLSQVI